MIGGARDVVSAAAGPVIASLDMLIHFRLSLRRAYARPPVPVNHQAWENLTSARRKGPVPARWTLSGDMPRGRRGPLRFSDR